MKSSNVQAAAAQQGFRRQRVLVKNQDYTVHAEGINVGYNVEDTRATATYSLAKPQSVAGHDVMKLQ